MIQEIEKLRAELDLLRLVDLEVLLQHQVEVNQVGTTEASNLGIAEAVSGLLAGSQGRGDERCLVHPAIQSLMAASAGSFFDRLPAASPQDDKAGAAEGGYVLRSENS